MNQLDVAALRRDFPVLDRTIYGKPLIYLDNTATSQTPSCVVDTIRDIYFHTKANEIGRASCRERVSAIV